MRRFSPAAAVLLVTALLTGCATTPAAPPPTVTVAAAAADPLRLTGSWPDPIPEYLVAHATGASVDLHDAPGPAGGETDTLTNPTWEGLPLLFRVLEERGPWLHVQVSRRPNESTAWIRRSQVEVSTVPNRIEIELSTRMVRVFHGDELLWESISVIGTDRTPTPLGTFFVDGWVPLEPGGAYGAGQLSVAGFSDVLHSFGGGVGQIAIHGTNRPDLMGSAASNGCIRLVDEKLLELIEFAPLGTPVVIRA